MDEHAPSATPGFELGNLLLIVVGAHLRAEVADRPLAYRLSQRVKKWLKAHDDRMNVSLMPVVCSDIWYVNQRDLQSLPTVSVGGPEVNALSAYFANKLPTAWVRDNHMLVQLDPEYVDLRVCVWGADHRLTVAAVDVFCEQYLEGYLRAVATQVEPTEG